MALHQPNAVEKMRDFISMGEEISLAAQQKKWDADANQVFNKLIGRNQDPKVLSLLDQISLQEAETIQKNLGFIFTQTWLEMIDLFPQQVTKELMLTYCKDDNYLHEETLLKVLNVFTKEDAREIITHNPSINVVVVCKILKIFSKAEAKDILIEFANQEVSSMDEESQLIILHFFAKTDAKEILMACVNHVIGLEGQAQMEIFDVLSSNDCKEILLSAIEHDCYLHFETLKKIIDYFAKDVAREIIKNFFDSNPAQEYSDEEKNEIIDLLSEKE